MLAQLQTKAGTNQWSQYSYKYRFSQYNMTLDEILFEIWICANRNILINAIHIHGHPPASTFLFLFLLPQLPQKKFPNLLLLVLLSSDSIISSSIGKLSAWAGIAIAINPDVITVCEKLPNILASPSFFFHHSI